MAMAEGAEVYCADTHPVTARGAEYTDAELDTALGGTVSSILWDDPGTADLEGILTGLVSTDFSGESLRRVLDRPRVPETWRVGEAIAEGFLVEHRNCEFPWPSGRDLRNPSASPAGTDLVGFQDTGSGSDAHRFAFGEVKTSAEGRYPPRVMEGRHGLQWQLEKLRDSSSTKDALMMYLGHHAPGQPWAGRFRSAAGRYLAAPSDVSLFGVLVRDVDPDPDDLSTHAGNLASGCPTEMSIELRAMYLPKGSIGELSERAARAREGRHGQE